MTVRTWIDPPAVLESLQPWLVPRRILLLRASNWIAPPGAHPGPAARAGDPCVPASHRHRHGRQRVDPRISPVDAARTADTGGAGLDSIVGGQAGPRAAAASARDLVGRSGGRQI